MRRLIVVSVISLLSYAAAAQSERYEQRYDLLVSKLGPAGVGVETVLDNWEKADSTNPKMLVARFEYLFTKSQTTQVVTKQSGKYLGMEPLLTVKDSTGNDVHYYQEAFYDDELYGQAVQAVDKAISIHPSRLEFRFVKANAYIAYEKESPDMAIAYLKELINEFRTSKEDWTYNGEKIDEEFFPDSMLEYCFSFYSIGSPAAMDAFLNLSQQMSALYPDNPAFVNNVGTYHFVAKQDFKTALKFYNKVLKSHPDDYTAIKNCILVAKKQNNLKLEKKYLQMMVKYGPEKEQMTAKARLSHIEK